MLWIASRDWVELSVSELKYSNLSIGSAMNLRYQRFDLDNVQKNDRFWMTALRSPEPDCLWNPLKFSCDKIHDEHKEIRPWSEVLCKAIAGH